MSWETRRKARLKRWLNPPGLTFESQEAKNDYQARITRMAKAMTLSGIPDRVPLLPNYTFMPAYVLGSNAMAAMSDQDLGFALWQRFSREFLLDSYNFYALTCPIPLMEKIQYLLYQWPGHKGLSEDQTYRYVPRDWLASPKKYADIAIDPSAFWLKEFVPLVCEALQGMSHMELFTGLSWTEPARLCLALASYGREDVQEAIRNLMEAGSLALTWERRAEAFVTLLAGQGYPSFAGGFSKAPFDLLTDQLRSRRNALLDIARDPEPLLEAIEVLTPRVAEQAIRAIDRTGNPIVFMPLHTGDDVLMSPGQFERFYWAPLKRVFELIIEAGGLPLAFAEGSYKSRCDYFLDLPRGGVTWIIDRTDMAFLKHRVGHHCCLAGNVPGYMFLMDDPKKLGQYCRKLIEEVAPGGGFMMSSGTALDKANRPMVRAMIETTLEHGVYG
ncbi:MAG: hypothetical protein LBL95_08865 [Deltaproteobacteria bacterium]|nr:hypothetical protein [Deltaproteobacteria bacterium]